MADPQKYDRAAAFEMLQKEHGEYASPELINRELDSFEKANGFSSNKPAPADATAPPTVSKQDQELQDTAKIYALPPSSARQQLESITSANPSTTTPVNNALDSFSKLSTKEQLLYGGGAAALAALATKKAGEIAVEGATKLKDRFFGDNTKPPINTSTQSATNAPLGESELKLSPVDQQILERANVNKQVRQEYLSRTMGNAEPALTTTTPEPVIQTPEQIRQAKLAANAQIAQQNMAAAPNVALQPVVPTEAAPVAAAPVEPVATPAAPAEPITTTTETPVTKNTNEKILETINKVAPKAEATPEITLAQETIEPTKVEPAKSTKTPKPEYFEGFKKLPGTERQLLGTLGVANNTERAKSLVNALKSTLPEGAALEFPKTEAGVSKGGMPNPHDVMAFTNKHLGTDMKLDEKGKFPADFRYTEENLAKMHQSVLDEYANAKTPAAKAAAEKGFATLRSLAGLAGFGALAYGSLEAYKHGKKTGDWTPAGELGLNTIAGAINPALMLGTHMTGLNAGEEQELAKRRYNAMVGGGRGVAPSSTYQR